MRYEAFFVRGTNGHGKEVEVFQPNIDAARVTRDRLISEGLQDVGIVQWNYREEPYSVE